MSGWIKCSDRLPEAALGEEGKPPIVSADVAVFWGRGISCEIANYDHEEQAWVSALTGEQYEDADPTHWTSLPELPE
jgi:hypothetical protein